MAEDFDHGSVAGCATQPRLRDCARLGEEDLFAYLCMHGALHWWNRLKWLADVNALLASTPEDGVERLVRAAEARGAGRAAAQALLLCRRLLGTPLPARLMATLDKSATVRWLEATALSAMTQAKANTIRTTRASGRPAAASRPFFSAGAGAIGWPN